MEMLGSDIGLEKYSKEFREIIRKYAKIALNELKDEDLNYFFLNSNSFLSSWSVLINEKFRDITELLVYEEEDLALVSMEDTHMKQTEISSNLLSGFLTGGSAVTSIIVLNYCLRNGKLINSESGKIFDDRFEFVNPQKLLLIQAFKTNIDKLSTVLRKIGVKNTNKGPIFAYKPNLFNDIYSVDSNLRLGEDFTKLIHKGGCPIDFEVVKLLFEVFESKFNQLVDYIELNLHGDIDVDLNKNPQLFILKKGIYVDRLVLEKLVEKNILKRI